MEEVEYLRSGQTLVTSTRIEIDGQTFAVRNVGSVKVEKGGFSVVAALVGGLLVIGGLMQWPSTWPALLIGAALIAYCVMKARLRKLVLVSGGGEVVALKSTNAPAVETLRAAIARAISAR